MEKYGGNQIGRLGKERLGREEFERGSFILRIMGVEFFLRIML
jgi:hypothetical protein